MGNERILSFARFLISGCTQTQAAKQAGYTGSRATLEVTGSRLAKHPIVIAEVARLRAKYEAAAATVTVKLEAGLIASKDEALAVLTSQIRDTELRPGDRQGAIEIAAKLLGWNEPEERNVNLRRDPLRDEWRGRVKAATASMAQTAGAKAGDERAFVGLLATLPAPQAHADGNGHNGGNGNGHDAGA